MCRVLSFPPVPDAATREVLTMINDDLQILRLNDPPLVYVAAELITRYADELRAQLGTPGPSSAGADLHLTASHLRVIALTSRTMLETVAIAVADLAQPIRIRLAAAGGQALLLPLLHVAGLLSGMIWL